VKRDVREPLLYAGILAALLGYRALRAVIRRRAAATRAMHSAPARPADPVTSTSRSGPTLSPSASD
jgi:sulfoxide reductase heme-binding subunit YedZ